MDTEKITDLLAAIVRNISVIRRSSPITRFLDFNHQPPQMKNFDPEEGRVFFDAFSRIFHAVHTIELNRTTPQIAQARFDNEARNAAMNELSGLMKLNINEDSGLITPDVNALQILVDDVHTLLASLPVTDNVASFRASAHQLGAETTAVDRANGLIELYGEEKPYTDAGVVAAHIEVLEELAKLAEQHYAVTSSAYSLKLTPSAADFGTHNFSAYTLSSGNSISQSLDDLIIRAELTHDPRQLLMEYSPAGAYLSAKFTDILNQSTGDRGKFKQLMAVHNEEIESYRSEGVPRRQPKGHIEGQDFKESLTTAKTFALGKIALMSAQLSAFEQELETQVTSGKGFRARLGEESNEGSKFIGGESTPPAPRQGGWSDNAS